MELWYSSITAFISLGFLEAIGDDSMSVGCFCIYSRSLGFGLGLHTVGSSRPLSLKREKREKRRLYNKIFDQRPRFMMNSLSFEFIN